MKKLFVLKIALFTVLSSVIFFACKEFKTQKISLNLPANPFDYMNGFENGTIIKISDKIKDSSKAFYNNHTVTLGRVLFYDKALSINNSVSCGTCHVQSMAFADGKALSDGFSSKSTPRSSMAIINPVDNNHMFWDSRSKSPLDLSLRPVFNHIEMGIVDDNMLIDKVNTQSYYMPLFEKAFSESGITKEKISIALTSFMNALFSKNSKFDQNFNSEFVGFTAIEKFGKSLFESDRLMCSQCHNTKSATFAAPDGPGDPYGSGRNHRRLDNGFAPPNMQVFDDPNSPKGTANIGLDATYKDNGFKNGQFKITSLRNIALTGPYMHDGRFKTLDDVLNHYSHGIKNHPNLDPKFKVNGQAKKLNITAQEKQAIIAFLNTLTDFTLINDKRFSNPFVAAN